MCGTRLRKGAERVGLSPGIVGRIPLTGGRSHIFLCISYSLVRFIFLSLSFFSFFFSFFFISLRFLLPLSSGVAHDEGYEGSAGSRNGDFSFDFFFLFFLELKP